MKSLNIRFDTGLVLEFEIENHDIADLWLEKFEQRHAWPLDDPSRFYGLKDAETERTRAIHDLKTCIDTINSYQKMIDCPSSDLDDQNTLNYLHNIFETYHGLLDQQDTAWWHAAPGAVKKALADLNIAVHRMESSRHNLPRIVCTWFGMPKTNVLDPVLMHRHGRMVSEWGGVYLNYVEIGKTLEDLATDNDQWIGDDAFQPFRHYSADFNIRFYDRMAPVARVYSYWEQHRDFFSSHGIHTWDDPAAFPYRFKIAQLKTQLQRHAVMVELSRVTCIVDTDIS
jgi:hypothetical protein